MRIGILTHNYPPHLGGLETLVQEIAQRVARQHEVIVVSTAWGGQTGIANEGALEVHRVPAWHGLEQHGIPYAFPIGPGLRRAVTALRSCDILHAHGSLYPTTVLGLLSRRKKPLFVTEHVGIVPYASAGVMAVQRAAWSIVGASVISAAHKVITYNSRVYRTLAARFGAAKVTFISNGVDTERFHPSDEARRGAARQRLGLPLHDVLGLFVGRDSRKKNLGAVIQFSGRGYRLVVCGAERMLPSHVIDLGARPHDEMTDVFAAADFLIHAAVGEGFPVTIQEAMASGLPVCLLWDEGYTGSVEREYVLASDTLDDLRCASETLARNRSLRSQLGTCSRSYAEQNWSWNTTIQQHIDLYVKALTENA